MAVVNEENKIVETLSIRDLKVLGGGYSFILETLSGNKVLPLPGNLTTTIRK